MALPDVPASVLPNHYEGDLSQFSDAYVQGRLDEAVDEVESRWGTLVQSRLDGGRLKTRHYQAIICRIATRVYRNPEGYRSETEGQYSYNLSGAVASGTIWFTADDERGLTGIDPKAKKLGTASIGRHMPGFTS